MSVCEQIEQRRTVRNIKRKERKKKAKFLNQQQKKNSEQHLHLQYSPFRIHSEKSIQEDYMRKSDQSEEKQLDDQPNIEQNEDEEVEMFSDVSSINGSPKRDPVQDDQYRIIIKKSEVSFQHYEKEDFNNNQKGQPQVQEYIENDHEDEDKYQEIRITTTTMHDQQETYQNSHQNQNLMMLSIHNKKHSTPSKKLYDYQHDQESDTIGDLQSQKSINQAKKSLFIKISRLQSNDNASMRTEDVQKIQSARTDTPSKELNMLNASNHSNLIIKEEIKQNNNERLLRKSVSGASRNKALKNIQLKGLIK